MITIQLSDGARGKPVRKDYPDFASFADDLREPDVRSDKLGAPVILPAELLDEDGSKDADNIDAVTLLSLDFDDVDEDDLVSLLADELNGLRWAAHTTWSHAESVREGAGSRYRVWVELDRPVAAEQWKLFRAKLDSQLPLKPDSRTRNVNRLSFAPSCTAADLDLFEYTDWRDYPGAEGATPLEVADVLLGAGSSAAATAPIVEEASYQPLDRDVVAKLQRSASKRKGAMEQLRAERLHKVLKGDAFVTSDSHDPTVDLARWLADELPLFSPEHLATLVAPSFAIMRAQYGSDETADGFVEKVRSWRTKKAKQKASLDSMPLPGQSMFTGPADAQPVPDDDGQPWFVQHQNTFWFKQRDMSYTRQMIRPEAESQYVKHLSGTPQSPFGWTKEGERKTLKFGEVVRGAHLVDGLVFRVADQSKFDAETNRMIMACCVRDKRIQAVEHPEIDAWLRGFFNEHAEAALDWLAIYPKQEYNSRILLMVGERHAGKTLMIKALSRIYGCDAGLKIEDADKWNSTSLRCPLVYADEQSSVKLSTLRSMVGGVSAKVRRKFMEDVEATIKFRVVFAANDLEMLRADGGVTAESLDATAERFLAIRIQRHEDLMPATREEREVWASRSVAEHVLWLSENRQIGGDQSSRLPGRAGGSNVIGYIAVNSDNSSTLCTMALDYLRTRSMSKNFNRNKDVLVRNGVLHVTQDWVRSRWKDLTEKMPTPRDVKSALFAVSSERTSVNVKVSGEQQRFWRLSTDRLVDAARDQYDEEVIREWLAVDDSAQVLKIAKTMLPDGALRG